MAQTKAQVREAEEARERLRGMLKPGDTVFTILRHVSRSGMQREISVRFFDGDGDCHYLDGLAARALGDRIGSHEGIVMGGAGMDMGFALVYNLSRTLFQDHFECIGDSKEYGKRCPSNDHSNERVADYTVGRLHSDGGYALRQRWI